MERIAGERRRTRARGRSAPGIAALAVAGLLAAPARADVGVTAGADARRFVAEHPVWRVSGDPDWRPYSFRTADGAIVGLDVELSRLLGERLGVRLEWVDVPSWADAVRRFRAREVDLLMGTALSPEREREMLFTSPYAASPVAVITRLESPFLVTLGELRGRAVAAPEGHVTTAYLRRLGFEVKAYRDLDAALRAVDDREADAAVAGLIPAATSVRSLGLDELKVAGLVDARFDLRVAVRPDWPLARDLLDRAIAADPPEVRAERFDRWLGPIMGLQRQAWRWRTLFLAGLGAAAALAAGVLGVAAWNAALTRRVERATGALRGEVLARAESEARFRAMFEQAPIGMYRSTPAGQFLSVNPFLARLLGWDGPERMVEEVNRAGIAGTLFEDPRVRARIVEEVATRPGGLVFTQVGYRGRDGRRILALLSMTAVEDPVSGQRSLLGFVQDVTERVREDATRARREKLLALGQLAGGVAHDLRNLLTVMKVGLQLLAEERAGDPLVAETVRPMREAANGAAALSDRLLRFVQSRGDGQPGPIDVARAVHGAAELFEAAAGHGVRVVEALGETETRVAGFELELQTALLNLFLNARDAMPDGGTLTVASRDVALGPEECAALAPYPLSPGRYLALEVSDTGAGMDAEVLARCREPFFTTKGDGTGLGLWMVHCVASGHRGALALASHPGAGTTVTIYLPEAAAGAERAAG